MSSASCECYIRRRKPGVLSTRHVYRSRVDRVGHESHVVLDWKSAAQDGLVQLAEVEPGVDIEALELSK